MPKLDESRLPAHAIAEINSATGERKAELQAFWESWAAVGDAKLAYRAGFDALAEKQRDLGACRHAERLGTVARGSCAALEAEVTDLLAAREAARADIEQAIAHHKAGG